MEQSSVGIGPEAQLLSNQEVEAWITCISTSHRYGVRYVRYIQLGIRKGLSTSLHREPNACFTEEAIELGYVGFNGSAPEWIFRRSDDGA